MYFKVQPLARAISLGLIVLLFIVPPGVVVMAIVALGNALRHWPMRVWRYLQMRVRAGGVIAAT